MRKRILAVSLGAALLIPATSAQASTSPIFSAVCGVSHISSDDPIVRPGLPGGAHSHDFTGAWSTNAYSTLESLRASGTTCNQPGDTASYWAPSLYDARGNRVSKRKKATFAYYVNGDKKDLKSIKPHPAGLKIIADMSTGARYGSGWHCGDGAPPSQGGTLSATSIPDCRNRDDGDGGRFPDDTRLQAKIVFPDCWDGKNLDSPDHRSHMVYASGAGKCPSSHPVPVPRLNLKNTYDTYGGPGFSVAIGEGAFDRGAPSTYHADFFNAWDQKVLAKLVATCINTPGDSDAPPCTHAGDVKPNPSYPNATASTSSPPAPPTAPPPPATTDPSPSVPSGCDDGEAYTGTLGQTGEGDSLPGSSGSYETVVSGVHRGCLTGPSGANFDLALKKLSATGAWTTVAQSTTTTSTESVTYSGTPGTYRWRVTSRSGSGDYAVTLAWPSPPVEAASVAPPTGPVLAGGLGVLLLLASGWSARARSEG